MKYYTRTVKITEHNKLFQEQIDIDSALEKEINYIYNNATVVNMTITPTIETKQGLRIVTEYWIVYTYTE